MKKTLLVLFLFSQLCFGQKQHNIWFFGYSAGVTFNSGSPVSINGGQTTTIEGCSSICDTSGNLLFYTEGMNVWNKNHATMPNGTGLYGGTSSTQSAIIVLQPGSNTIYYIFTAAEAGGSQGLCYSVVDMTLNGGLGDVTTKNFQLQTPMSEKLTAIRHANGTDIWIISHDLYGDGFYAYLLTSTGVNITPVITHIGTTYSGIAYIGYMKVSPDGTKLAAALQGANTFELYDFNTTNAAITNVVYFPTTYVWTYGIEFSPDSKRLYGSKYGNSLSEIYQFDLTAGNAAAIVASAVQVALPGVQFVGALQLGPDGKIYVARYSSSMLGVINYPDSLGLACNYVDQAVSLSGTCELGLPNCFPSVFYTPQPALPTASFFSSDTAFCTETGECINFFDQSTGNPTSWHWIFTGAFPDTSTLQNPTNICYSNPGTYPVTLIVTNSNGSDTLAVTPLIIYGTAPAPPTITVIGGDTLISSNAAHYQWYFNGSIIAGATDSFYVAHQGGTYAVQITDSLGCTSLSNGMLITGISSLSFGDEIGVRLYPNPVSDELTVSFLSLPKSGGEVIVTDILGKELVKGILDKSKSSQTISMREFNDGMYLLQIRLGSEIVNKKFIVLHH